MITGSYGEGSFSSQAALLWAVGSQGEVTEQVREQDEGPNRLRFSEGKPLNNTTLIPILISYAHLLSPRNSDSVGSKFLCILNLTSYHFALFLR